MDELTTLGPIDELSAEQLSTIAIVAYLGTATRRQIESIRGPARLPLPGLGVRRPSPANLV